MTLLAANLASRVIYSVDLGEVLSVAVGAERWSHQGPSWYDAAGKRAAGGDAVRLAALVRHLASAPAVAGYGPMPPGALRVVIGTTRGDVALRAAGGLVGVEGRPVRYKVAPEVCERWPVVCLGR